jgi:hypothetical protein
MPERDPDPREADEWRVEVDLEADEHGRSLAERLRALDLDDEARRRLGGSVIVTRDGPHLFAYAWHEQGAQEAERVIRDLMEEDGIAGRVSVMRWHPVADAWRPAGEPLPESELERSEEQRLSERAGEAEHTQTGEYPWEVVIDLPDLRSTRELADELDERGLPVKRRFKYLLVGQPTEEKAIELGRSFEGKVPDGSHVSVRGNPHDMPSPGFVLLGSLKPGVMRDLGL